METQSNEARILLVIAALRRDKKLSRRAATRIYNVPYSTLTDRINSYAISSEYRPVAHKLTELEEEVIIQHILELDTRGFGPRLAGIEDIANSILESRQV